MDPTAIKALSKKISASFRRMPVVVVRHDDHEAHFRPITIGETMAMVKFYRATAMANLEWSTNVGWPVGVVFGATDCEPLSSRSDGIWICCVDAEGTPQWRAVCQTCFDLGARIVRERIETWSKNAADHLLSDNGSWLEIDPTIDAIRLLLQKQSA